MKVPTLERFLDACRTAGIAVTVHASGRYTLSGGEIWLDRKPPEGKTTGLIEAASYLDDALTASSLILRSDLNDCELAQRLLGGRGSGDD